MLADTLKENNKHEPQRGQSQREYYLSDRGSVGEDVLLRSDDSLAITAENEHAKFVGEPDRVGFPRPNLASAPENQTCQHGDDAVVGQGGDDSGKGQGGTDTLAGGSGGGAKDSGDVLSDATAGEIDEAFSLDFDDLIGQTN